MIVALTAISEFSGKDGRSWVKLSYVKENGEAGFAIFEKGKHATDDLQVVKIAPERYTTGLQFDERGRLTEIE